MIRVAGDNVLAGTGTHGRRAFHVRPEGAHDARAIRLLLHRDFHLVDGALQSVELSGVGQRGTPLPGSCLCGHVGVSLLFAVVALRQGGIDFVGSQRVGGLVLEIDVCGRVQCLLQPIGSYQGCGTIVGILVTYFLGDVYPGMLGVQLLYGTFAGEYAT